MSTQSQEPSDHPPVAASSEGPAPKPAKPRVLQDGRDMFWSIAPLIAACIVLAGLVGMCSFQPNGPKAGQVPSYDAVGALGSDAETLGFPIRLPAVPDDWQANSGRRDGLDGARTDPATGQPTRALVSTVGYITGSGMYLSLTQSNADEDKLVRSIHPDVAPTGVEDVDGVRWVVYDGGERDEPVWTTRIGETQLAITGAGSTDEFRTLARATQSQEPLPAKRS
ncbi:DUF4245 domain-containing protein [Mycobacterium sp. ACS4331]|uniref:DUF4245 domain-containing protein n=1 Tax=Mycobacterium sp. ACS4331 TaxID=1834121 RepID=UPI0007FE0B7B|nr:DUF4245 domain-containing protein [Mycobacterium sp. ACS4331]OBF30147.1 hypothetical protein A5727_22550 [Mycobacterium sp. ACS4331]